MELIELTTDQFQNLLNQVHLLLLLIFLFLFLLPISLLLLLPFFSFCFWGEGGVRLPLQHHPHHHHHQSCNNMWGQQTQFTKTPIKSNKTKQRNEVSLELLICWASVFDPVTSSTTTTTTT